MHSTLGAGRGEELQSHGAKGLQRNVEPGPKMHNASCHMGPAAWPQKPQWPPEQQWHF